MKLKLSLLLMCLFCTGLFASAQVAKKPVPKVENGPDAIPVTVTSGKKHAAQKHKIPPPPPPIISKTPPPPPAPAVPKVPPPPPPKAPTVKSQPPVPEKIHAPMMPAKLEKLLLRNDRG